MDAAWEALGDAPAIGLVALTLGAALLLVEVALPTFGVAGGSALAMGVLGVASVAASEEPWWPFLLIVTAVGVWAVSLTVERPVPAAPVAAAASFAVGSVSFGLLAGDAATVAVAIAGSVALPVGFPRLFGVARRLLDQPPQTGMAALVGRPGTVVRADVAHLGVRVDGSLWNARSVLPVDAGEEVVVTGFTGTTLQVLPAVVPPW